MYWDEEDMPKGATCVFSEELEFNIIIDPNGEVEHVEDCFNMKSFASLKDLQEEIFRLTQLETKVSNYKWQ